MSLTNKLDEWQIEDIKRKWAEAKIKNSGEIIHISNIAALPYGYLVSFTYKDGFPYSSFCVNFNEDVEVLPTGNFAKRIEDFFKSCKNKI